MTPKTSRIIQLEIRALKLTNAILTDNKLQEVNRVMFDDAVTNHQYQLSVDQFS